MIELVVRPGVVINEEKCSFATHVVISWNWEEKGCTEIHFFCEANRINEYLEKAKLYEDSKVASMTIADYIAKGHAYIRTQII